MLKMVRFDKQRSLFDVFVVNVCGRDLPWGRPTPAIFLLAAAELQIRPDFATHAGLDFVLQATRDPSWLIKERDRSQIHESSCETRSYGCQIKIHIVHFQQMLEAMLETGEPVSVNLADRSDRLTIGMPLRVSFLLHHRLTSHKKLVAFGAAA